MPAARAELAPAKINLTLRVIGRRPDGYHDIDSLVVFAALGDTLSLTRGRDLSLVVNGPTAAASGALADNLVLKAARQLSDHVPGLTSGQFVLSKRLPVAAGMGGGSADAAAALRLLARANAIAPDDPRLLAAARATGADVPVCLDPRPRVMRGIGEILSEPLDLPRLPAVLVNPRVAVPTKDVFERLAAARIGGAAARGRQLDIPRDRAAFMAFLCDEPNDLEPPAIAVAPAIADVLAALQGLVGCRLARMSGSGATTFGLFDSTRAAAAGARTLRNLQPLWWVRVANLG